MKGIVLIMAIGVIIFVAMTIISFGKATQDIRAVQYDIAIEHLGK